MSPSLPEIARTLALSSCALLASSAPLGSQQVHGLRALHRSGQTFLTWKELATPGASYRVYRAPYPIRDAPDLAAADWLGEVNELSSRNLGRTYAVGSEVNWIISDGAAPLADDDGLFVYTVEGLPGAGASPACYAVTSVVGGVEDRTLARGSNTIDPVLETPAPPQPVVQKSDPQGMVFGHWVGNRETPYQPALSFLPSQGFDFRFDPGTAPGPRGLLVRLHAAGQDYAQAWPHRYEVPDDVDILAPNDLYPRAGWTFWLGLREGFPGPSDPAARVQTFTQTRLLWTIDWIARRQGAEHDLERVYAVGGSMGAMGSMYLASAFPERFAAILCRNGNYDLTASDLGNPPVLERVFGSFDQDLPTSSGLGVLERTNAAFMASLDPGSDWPVIRTISGRNDTVVGWESAVQLFEGLTRTYRPAVHYFDLREHEPQGYWQPLERALLERTVATRRDRPSLRFSELDLDDSPGDGDPLRGDPIGCVNGYAEYDPTTALGGDDFAELDVFLRDEGALDDSPRALGWARLTPRRLGAFVADLGQAVHFTLCERGELVDEHLLFPDEHGLVHTPLAPLTREQRRARFERWTLPASPYLFLGDAPLPGDRLQAVIFGEPAQPWALWLALGDDGGPWLGHPGSDHVLLRGSLDDSGRADLAFRLPLHGPAGTRVFAQAWVGKRPTLRVSVRVQAAQDLGRPGVPGSAPDRTR